MNKVSYNLVKFQSDKKLNNKKLSVMLGYDTKTIRNMKKETYVFNDNEIKQIASVMNISEYELQNEMNEYIDLKERKIYGTNYLYLRYKVNNYETHLCNLISCIIDIVFIIILAIFLLTKQISLSIDYTSTLNVLKVIFVIELLVFPFMFIVFPLLKVYFNRTYNATLTTNLKEEYQDEACGLIEGCLRRSMSKSILPFLFTIFSEGVIALYCLNYLMYIKSISVCYFIMIILFVISFGVSIYSFKYHFNKYNHKIFKGEEYAKESISD